MSRQKKGNSANHNTINKLQKSILHPPRFFISPEWSGFELVHNTKTTMAAGPPEKIPAIENTIDFLTSSVPHWVRKRVSRLLKAAFMR
mgnify:CR=1 FL=1